MIFKKKVENQEITPELISMLEITNKINDYSEYNISEEDLKNLLNELEVKFNSVVSVDELKKIYNKIDNSYLEKIRGSYFSTSSLSEENVEKLNKMFNKEYTTSQYGEVNGATILFDGAPVMVDKNNLIKFTAFKVICWLEDVENKQKEDEQNN